MLKKYFEFLGNDAFGKLSQREKLDYLTRATAAVGRTAAAKTAQYFEQDHLQSSPGTLGAVLYSDKRRAAASEKDWVELVQSIAAGDPHALHGLYERSNRPVFTLLLRITGNREIAEKLTLAVFRDIRLQAPHYDAGNGTVLGWLMNQARAKAGNPSPSQQRNSRVGDPLPVTAMDDMPSPAESLQRELAQHVAAGTGTEPVYPAASQWKEPEWEDVAPGISCKLLATDMERHRVSLFVRLAPGGDYPPHIHSGVEELHLLAGELWINDRKLYPGDYSRAEPGTGDKRVWSETGCTCVLITSTEDILT